MVVYALLQMHVNSIVEKDFNFILHNKKRRNATKTRFSMIQPSIDMTGIRNERWQ